MLVLVLVLVQAMSAQNEIEPIVLPPSGSRYDTAGMRLFLWIDGSFLSIHPNHDHDHYSLHELLQVLMEIDSLIIALF